MPTGIGGLPFLDTTSKEFAADPHGQLRELRAASWIVRTPDGIGVLSYEACNALLLDPRFRPGVFEMSRRASPDGAAGLSGDRTLLGSEGEAHQQLRRVVMPWFTPRRIEALRVQTRQLVSELLARVESSRRCEFMHDVARPIPQTVFCWMAGYDIERGAELARWSATALQVFSGDPSVMNDVRGAIRELRAFADELIEAKTRAPGDDITSALLEATHAGVLTTSDVRVLLTELLSASVDNTSHSIGLAMWLLCRHPDQWQRIVDDPSLIERAVEECARFEPAIRHGHHFNESAADVLGFDTPPRSLVTSFIAAAHRDPDVYQQPDEFDVGRRPARPPLLFGIGRHYCVGAALARMEIQEVVWAVTGRFTDPRLAAGVQVTTARSGTVERLPMSFELAATR